MLPFGVVVGQFGKVTDANVECIVIITYVAYYYYAVDLCSAFL